VSVFCNANHGARVSALNMRRTTWIGLLPALALAASGCSSREMGDKAPAFGSSAKLSTMSGFLEGRWKSKIDESTARAKAPSLGLLEPSLFLEFHANHTCEFDFSHHVAHMTWKEAANGIELAVADVDGVDPATAKSDAAKATPYRRYDLLSDVHFNQQMRGAALDLAEMIKRLELMPDKRRLFQPNPVRPDGSTFLGTETWVRVQ
ncbi:MAG: hypothetical protein ACHQ50_10940, partial [Fimbriimonadales bacterium]